MQINYKYILIGILIEVILIILVTILTFILIRWHKYKTKLRRRHHAELINLFRKYFNHEVTLEKDKFRLCRMRQDVLIPLIKDFDKKKGDDPEWIRLRRFLIAEYVFPYLDKFIHSKDFEKIMWSIQGVMLCECLTDEESILKLLNNKMSMIRIFATSIAVKLESEKLINCALDIMAHEKYFLPVVYRRLFKDSSEKVFAIVGKRLASEAEDELLLETCYQILASHSEKIPAAIIMRDISSGSTHLRIVIADVAKYMKKEKAVPVLLKALQDSSAIVQTTALISLRILKALEAIDDIAKLLSHKHRWVRYNAAYALWGLGEQGVKVLNSVPVEDVQAYDIAQEILAIPVDRKEHLCELFV